MRRTGAEASRGFTLVEVLIALGIVAVAIIASLRAMGNLAQTNVELRLRLLAQMAAENRINVVRASRAFPALGERSLPCPQGEAVLVCDQLVMATPNTVFRRLEVRVHEPDKRFVLAKLVTVIPDGL